GQIRPDKVKALTDAFAREVAVVGAAAGVAAAAPAVGTTATFLASAAEIAWFTGRAGDLILTIAALSFIGLGAVPPTPEWGAMISVGRYKFYNWWMTTFPGLAVLSVVLAYNFFGDGVRDAFDPRMMEQ
ncbi:MAG: ABC transporter permease subunit, partial [Deltaproteobacteria bacterium]